MLKNNSAFFFIAALGLRSRYFGVVYSGLAALMVSACYDNTDLDSHPCDVCMPCETCMSVQDGKATCRPKAGVYRKCGNDGFVHSFNSCNQDEGAIFECVAGNSNCVETLNNGVGDAQCVCLNHWQGNSCDQCPGNWNPDQSCNACRTHWQGPDCAVCPENWDTGADCAVCINHWEGDSCEICPGNWNPAMECNECQGNWDEATACVSCTNAFDPSQNCATCLYGWSGENCDTQEYCVRYVDSNNLFPVPNGASWATAFRTISEGIEAAAGMPGTCDVWVAAGTYYIYETGRNDTVLLQPHIRLYGGFAGDEIALSQRDLSVNQSVLDGKSPTLDDYVYHVITGAGDTLVDGFTITGGRADNEDDLSPHRGGGGLYNGSGPIAITNCIFVENHARRMGGAIANVESQAAISNCIFANNTSDSVGGAVDNYKSTATFSNCTFYGNEAASDGGALRNYSSNIDIYNSILWNDLPGELHNTTSALVVKYNNIDGGYPDTDNISVDPKFDAPESTGFSLQADSPCIDAADGSKAPETDLAGQPRIDMPDIENSGTGTPDYADIGALEYHL